MPHTFGGQGYGLQNIDINVEPAWNITMGNGNVKVAVIDDGVEDHEDLKDANNVSRVLDGYTPSCLFGCSGHPLLSGKHGQCCAGIIAASHNNIGIAGVAPNSKIVPIRIMKPKYFFSEKNIAKAINKAWDDLGCDILSNSWDKKEYGDAIISEFEKAVEYGRNGKGCVIVSSSGNEDRFVFIDGTFSIMIEAGDTPANYIYFPYIPNATIMVGAITQTGSVAYYSNRGSKLSVVAPSSTYLYDKNFYVFSGNVRTIDREGNKGYNEALNIEGNYWGDFDGTSVSCSLVSGIASLILSVNPNLHYNEVVEIIETTCRKIFENYSPNGYYDYTISSDHTHGSWNNQVGYGLVNAHAAVMEAYFYNHTVDGNSNMASCNEGTYSLSSNAVPNGTTLSWEVSDNLEIVSGQGTSSINVRAIAGGNGWVKVNLSHDGYTVTKDKSVYVTGYSSLYKNYTVTGTVPFNTGFVIAGTFTVSSGSTATISTTAYCAPDAKIVIEASGKLVVDGGTITNLCPDKMWNAIYVVGNTYQRQLADKQGTLEIKNNSVIENSSWGIVTWNGTSYGTTGGIVKCTNSTFRNNGRQVEFYPYTNHNASNEECNNVSFFKNCNFTIDDNNLFSASNVTYTDMIKMSGVRGISIRGCHFSDNRTGMPARGCAIRIAGASANIKPSCSFGDYTSNLPCNCTGESRNTFYCFTKSIDVENTGSNYSFYVFKTDFEKCKQSVYASAVNNYSITMSDINLTGVESLSPENGYGIYSSNCTGYKIEGNSIYTTNSTSVFCQTNGIYMHNSGVDNIHRNAFGKLDRGIYSDNNPGLLISCNEFSNIFNNDIKTTGFVCHQGSSSTGAGNQFTAGVLNIKTDNTNYPKYYFSGQANSSNPYYLASIQGSITRTSSSAANECNPTICIVPVYPPIDPPIVGPILGKSAPSNDDISLYESLKQIYESRLADYDAAGYDFLLENFEEGDADIVAVARLMQDTLVSIRRAMAEIANRNIDAILQDTIVFDREALNGWYNRINTQTAKYSLVNSYFEMGEYALARQELAAIPQRFALTIDELAEYDNFCQYQSLREAVYTDGRNYAQLTEDEIAELQVMVERNTGVSSAYANSVLCFFYGICRDEEIDIDFDIDAPMNSKSTTEVVEENAEPLAIYVYPNPADEELNILLNSLPEGKTMIEFHDVTGRLVLSEEIKGNSTSINISSLRQGVYMYRIVNGDNVIARDRIVKE
ncbi:MAG: S8 family peptidase [Bacteroidales bacterium]|nr:S8 family peptidase [Bacteroidales bacterium]